MKLSFPGARRTLTYLFALCGTALFIYLVRSVGAAKILRSIQQIGWGMLAIVAVGGCTFIVRSLAWRCTLGREYRHLPVRTLFPIYVAGEAMGLLFFGGLVVGDTTRVLMLRGAVPTIRAISSVILDRGLYIVGSAIFLAATILLLPLAPHGGTAIPRMIYVIGSIYAAIMALVWIGMRRRMQLLSGLFSLLSKLPPLRAWTGASAAERCRSKIPCFTFSTLTAQVSGPHLRSTWRRTASPPSRSCWCCGFWTRADRHLPRCSSRV